MIKKSKMFLKGRKGVFMHTVTWFIPAISCGHCTHTIEMEVGALPGVRSVKADKDSRMVTITFAAPATEEKIKALLAEIHYPVGSPAS